MVQFSFWAFQFATSIPLTSVIGNRDDDAVLIRVKDGVKLKDNFAD
jgi:hypothetical protein